MPHSFLRSTLACLLVLSGGPTLAGDPAAGRELAGTCRVCHGLDGVGTNPMIPNLGGQSEMYLAKQLQDFREGRRFDDQMSIIAEGLTDEQIDDLAAYYASIKADYTLPE